MSYRSRPLPPPGKQTKPPLPPILSLFADWIVLHPVVIVSVGVHVGSPLSQT